MEVFRISKTQYANKALTASGVAARWNKDNQSVLYTGSSRSLSILEMVVHRNSIKTLVPYKVMVINLRDDEALYKRLLIKDLPKNWREYQAYPALQEIGSAWYESKESLILQVPSVIVHQEFNYVINTHHPLFDSAVHYVESEDFYWDERLLN